ncbi:MAG TPA: UvrB/UvrC motif-containing protein [Phycisphaerae bacterium]|jgi:protein arginine kinase activator
MGILICQNCQKAPATVHLTDIIPPHGEKRERHLCDTCAVEEGITTKQHESVQNVLQEFIKQKAGIQEIAQVTCPECGISFREFRNQGLLGCSNDYKAFDKYLTPLIERAHDNATHHIGKVPARAGSGVKRQDGLSRLKRELEDAIESENYERAARLRDQIRTMET